MNYRLVNIIRLSVVIIIISSTFLISKDNNGDYHTVKIIMPKTALLDIESIIPKNTTLNMASPLGVGNPNLSNINNNLWLNVTSNGGFGNIRDITVKHNAPISEIDFIVISNKNVDLGFGSWGVPQAELTITNTDQTFVSSIKNGFISDGTINGFNIHYTVKSNNFTYGDTTNTDGNNITVTYTLTN